MPTDLPTQLEHSQDDLLSVVLDCAQIGLVIFEPSGRCTGINAMARCLLELGEASVEDFGGFISQIQAPFNEVLTRLGTDETEVVSAHEELIRLSRKQTANGSAVITVESLVPAQTLREQRLFARIGRLRSRASSPTDFPSQILTLLFEELPLDVAVFAVLDRDVLRPVAWRGLLLDPIGSPLSLSDPVIQSAISTGEVILAKGTELSLTFDTEEYFIVPLKRDGVIHGILQISFVASADESWGPIDPKFLKELGRYIAHALQNVVTFQKLVDEENRLRLLVQSLPEGVLVFDGRGDVLVSNPAACEILEVDLKRLNTDPRPYQLRDASMNLLARADWPFFRAARLGHIIQDELIVIDFDGRFKYVEVSVLLLPGADGRTSHFMGALRDVTQRTQDDRRKDEFLSVASHELRSPLTPLKGLIQMALKQAECGEDVDQNLLKRADEQTHRLARLIDDMLDVSRLESGHLIIAPESIDLNALATTLVGRFWPEVLVICDEPVWAWADPRRLEQVLVNLVENARKHSQHTSPIEIRISDGGMVAMICVWDNGQGIAAEHIPHIFERFYRGSNRTSGTGLGLNISKQIIEQHGGHLRVETESGKGTALYIELPRRSH